jgi:CheY-like chemotaxis protein/AraC-like DNA-binding protein
MPLESLLGEDKIPSCVKERVFTAYRSADKMMGLVNELMEFNKIESGNLKLLPRHGELINFVRDVASVFDDLAVRKNINFSVRAEVPALSGWFDRDKLEKIVVNLLSNAFKFTADGGKITVILKIRELHVGNQSTPCRCLELVVVDNGMGISSEEIPHIFDKFYQAKSAAKIPNPGTGIGLSLTKALVELHQGLITVESKPEHETKFTIVLPIDAQIHGVENEMTTPADVFYEIDDIKPTGDDPLHANVQKQNTDKPEVLVVEDNDELRTYLAAELRHQFTVLEASDGLEGLQMAMDKMPDLIISDILMANMTGIELCKTVKGDIKTSHIPFIMLTAKATVEDQITGIETGADIYLTKPFSMRFLLTQVRNIIESRQKLYCRFSQDVYLLPAKMTSNEIDQTFLQGAVDYIIEHIQDTQLGIDSLADRFNLSRVQLYRKIKALTGKPAVEFIRTVRLKQALKLMETKKYTLSEIAYQTGFSSAPYFTRSFKEVYGKAPSEYLEVSA